MNRNNDKNEQIEEKDQLNDQILNETQENDDSEREESQFELQND